MDASERQLSLARALQAEHGADFPLVHADAERVPYPDASFDLALSEYGASSWCDPYRCRRRPGCCGRAAGCCSSW